MPSKVSCWHIHSPAPGVQRASNQGTSLALGSMWVDMGVACLAWAAPRTQTQSQLHTLQAQPCCSPALSILFVGDDSTRSPSTKRWETEHPPGGFPRRPELGSEAQSWERSRGEEGLGLGW